MFWRSDLWLGHSVTFREFCLDGGHVQKRHVAEAVSRKLKLGFSMAYGVGGIKRVSLDIHLDVSTQCPSPFNSDARRKNAENPRRARCDECKQRHPFTS